MTRGIRPAARSLYLTWDERFQFFDFYPVIPGEAGIQKKGVTRWMPAWPKVGAEIAQFGSHCLTG